MRVGDVMTREPNRRGISGLNALVSQRILEVTCRSGITSENRILSDLSWAPQFLARSFLR
jgi:hypothetical protein